MIIWLASYPRSGNTLLRTVLFQSFGTRTYSVDRDPNAANSPITNTNNTKDIIGLTDFDEPDWESFYNRASESDDIFLVKTHKPPVDRQPAIYVVRDGRSSALSYLDFHNTYHPEAGRTLDEIIVGDDAYGSWSEHYNAWNSQHAGPVMVVYFNQLVNCDENMQKRLADFIGYTGPITAWKNPREELNKLAPWFIREGKTDWSPEAPWDRHYDRLFYAMHGDLMKKLGMYLSNESQQLENDAEKESYKQITSYIKKLVFQKNTLQDICDKRQEVISGLQDSLSCLHGNAMSRIVRKFMK